jgi:hypothetical protein
VLSLHRFIINDSYHADLVLVHPPHVLAVAALVLALGQPTAGAVSPQDAAIFIAGLNMPMPAVAAAVQELLALYARWARVRDDAVGGDSASPGLIGSARGAVGAVPGTGASVSSAQLAGILANMRERHFTNFGALLVNKRLERAAAAG